MNSFLIAGMLLIAGSNVVAVDPLSQAAAGACIGMTIGSGVHKVYQKADEKGLVKEGGWFTVVLTGVTLYHAKNLREGIVNGSGIGDAGLTASLLLSVGKFGYDWYYSEPKKINKN